MHRLPLPIHPLQKTANSVPTPSSSASLGTPKLQCVKENAVQDHLTITSSIGRALDYWRILPRSQERVFVKPISGRKMQTNTHFLKKSTHTYKSITILVGGNNMSAGDSLQSCVEGFHVLLQIVQEHHPRSSINLYRKPITEGGIQFI
jgi:hypothetical protein